MAVSLFGKLYPTMNVLFVFLIWIFCTERTTGFAGDALPKISYSITNDDLLFHQVEVDGVPWLLAEGLKVRADGVEWSILDGSLHLVHKTEGHGHDGIGPFRIRTQVWTLGNLTGGARVETAILHYYTKAALVFRQSFPDGLNNTSAPFPTDEAADHLASEFPAFQAPAYRRRLGFVSFAGNQIYANTSVGEWSEATEHIPDGKEGSLLVLFRPSSASRRQVAVVMSALTNPMTVSMVHSPSHGNALRWGMLGSVSSVPAGHSMEVVVSAGRGVNAAMRNWGALVLARHGNRRTFEGLALRDKSLSQLGYSTDNGGYYYYWTGSNTTSYEEAMLQVAAYAKQNNIPYRYMLLDSWFYTQGINGGVKDWSARPDVFPNGLQHLHETTNMSFQLHNRYWAPDNVYAKQNGGSYEFLVEEQYALPLESRFWEFLLTRAKSWGMNVYEQDWLHNEFEGMHALLESATLARTWLLQMGDAAERLGLSIQYCMCYPRHAVQSAEVPSVTQMRVSQDYTAGNDQWKVGITSMLAYALALAPSKDTFWTTEARNSDTPKHPGTTEPYAELQAMIATYTAGPVAPSDMVNATNRELLMRSCTTAGDLLHPSRPATIMDVVLEARVFGDGPTGELWSSYSEVSGLRWAHVIAAELESPHEVSLRALSYDLGESWRGEGVAYTGIGPSNNITVIPVSSRHGIPVAACGKSDFQLWHVASFLNNGWVLLGETSKWVPVAPRRVLSVYSTDAEARVQIHGAPGEYVNLLFANNKQVARGQSSLRGAIYDTVSASQTDVLVPLKVLTVYCVIPESGTAIAMVPSLRCG